LINFTTFKFNFYDVVQMHFAIKIRLKICTMALLLLACQCLQVLKLTQLLVEKIVKIRYQLTVQIEDKKINKNFFTTKLRHHMY
jgi:hypothetical protein